MTLTSTYPRQVLAAVHTLALLAASSHAAIVFEDDFTDFSPGERWLAHGAGIPDVA